MEAPVPGAPSGHNGSAKQWDAMFRDWPTELAARQEHGPQAHVEALFNPVVPEFSAVALHPFSQPMATSDLKDLHQALIWPACVILPARHCTGMPSPCMGRRDTPSATV